MISVNRCMGTYQLRIGSLVLSLWKQHRGWKPAVNWWPRRP